MRKVFMLAASLAFIGASAANAQTTPTPSQPPAQPPTQPPAAEPDAAPKIQRFNVVDVSELPQETQKQVEQVVAQGNDATLKELHSTIDATPEAKAALDAKGATSEQVVATAMSKDGTLTLITKKKS
ncbi:MAG: hypothetical protein ACTHNH_08155 [Mesorhizobium sp.]